MQKYIDAPDLEISEGGVSDARADDRAGREAGHDGALSRRAMPSVSHENYTWPNFGPSLISADEKRHRYQWNLRVVRLEYP